MHDGILQVPYGTRFTHQLPYFTYQDKMVELCTCQLLTLVMEQISGSLSLWKHVTKHYSSTIKNLVSRLFASPPSSSSYCFLIGQYFCHICQVASIVQSEVLEQIFVLSLELLNTLDEFASNNHTIDSMELINQKTVMLSAVAMVPDCEKRSRLVQKMNTVFEG
ncbi:gem-associated protein 4-like [Saccoglossus kowalevskii]|uniref:Uncharacterized protein LOC102808955 n=1 Tax=Saccoglossus kowalevskii TaxID=10224 RepID=A0ABM0M6A7_SACKO|nr:PREDICTED: uncharacterized protein LOC102808955 [Saccoglossus kowalevskii]